MLSILILKGEDADGNEVELDMIQTTEGWQVVEIQRDISLAMTPKPVLDALYERHPDIVPARIIESDQGEGTIVYEFFTRDETGEAKFEVKLDATGVQYLEEEWVH